MITQRLPLIMSSVALAVALTGVTPAVAVNAVRRALFASNSGAVNGIRASRAPTPNKLLPLDAKGHFPASVIPPLPVARGPQGPAGPAGVPGAAATLPAPQPWQPLPFAAGWGDYGAGFITGAYRKDQLGRVELRGLVTKLAAAVPAVGDVIATLPVADRPVARMTFAVAAGEPNQFARVDVLATGEVVWDSWASPAVPLDPDHTSLNTIEFWTD